MSKKFQNLKLGLDEDLEEKLEWLVPNYSTYHILKKSVDARRKHEPHFIYSLEVYEQNETPTEDNQPVEKIKYKGDPVLVVGAGPAGLFAALRLVERGIPCILFEQGSKTKKRLMDINRFWRYGELNPRNNVCFGEGGAGLFSDGKLITRIKSPYIPYVMHRLVQFGAPEEIKYLANPHVGSDRIRRVIPKIREEIEKQGGKILFDTKVMEVLTKDSHVTGVKTEDGKEYKSDHTILACGHSSEEIFHMLHQKNIFMEGKSFALGLRVEHPQKKINELQYRKHAENPKLGAANYRLAYHNNEARVGVYSFCMCPGGYVLSSGTDLNGIVCNGMSNYNRNSPFANAAVVASIDHQKSFGEDLFGGLKFRAQIEADALAQVRAAGGTKEIPAQKLNDFFDGRSGELNKSSSLSGVAPARLDQLFSDDLKNYLYKGISKFDQSMKGFICEEAQFHGVESRTSCPIRITRDKESLESISHRGLYPTGEGAGYAGGITSAACDGIKVVEAIVTKAKSS